MKLDPPGTPGKAAVVIALVTGDPYVGFFGSFVATGATGFLATWMFKRSRA
jgi:hypothetical protein